MPAHNSPAQRESVAIRLKFSATFAKCRDFPCCSTRQAKAQLWNDRSKRQNVITLLHSSSSSVSHDDVILHCKRREREKTEWKKLTRIRPVVVWPDISSPAQSLASVMNVPSNSCLPRLAFCSFCFGSLGDSSGSFRQHMKAKARHSSTMKSPARNVNILDSRKHHHFRSIRHSSIGSSVVTNSSAQLIPNELCTVSTSSWGSVDGDCCWLDSYLCSLENFRMCCCVIHLRYRELSTLHIRVITCRVHESLITWHFERLQWISYFLYNFVSWTHSSTIRKLNSNFDEEIFTLNFFSPLCSVIDAHACYLRYWFCNIFSLFSSLLSFYL